MEKTTSLPGLEATAERLDRLMTLEVRPLTGGLPAGIVVPTYLAAREQQGSALSLLAASKLNSAVREADNVLIVTGAGVAPKLPFGETDGPPGAVVLGWALKHGMKANPVFVSQNEHLPAVEALCDYFWPEEATSYQAREFPTGEKEGNDAARALLDEFSPTAIIFVERDGPNEAGHYHGVRGDRRPKGVVAHLNKLADLAKERGILTIGIGDGGNEIGFGLIRDTLSTLLPNNGRSQPDETGVATVTSTDVLLSASVSNWGCYAIVGTLSVYAGKNLLHTAQDEANIIEACVEARARDGATGTPDVAVDGIDADGNGAIITLMRAIVDAGINARRQRKTADQSKPEHSNKHGLLHELTTANSQGGVYL